MESIKKDLKTGVRLEEFLDELEVEDLFKHGDIVFYRVDDFDSQIIVCLGPDFGEIDLKHQYLKGLYSPLEDQPSCIL